MTGAAGDARASAGAAASAEIRCYFDKNPLTENKRFRCRYLEILDLNLLTSA